MKELKLLHQNSLKTHSVRLVQTLKTQLMKNKQLSPQGIKLNPQGTKLRAPKTEELRLHLSLLKW